MTTGAGPRIDIPLEQIRAFCRRWRIEELALFGSVLRDDFGPESDVDVLVTCGPGAEHTLQAYLAMQAELTDILGREVDLVDREAIAASHNWLRRRRILESARTVYAA